MRFQKKQKQKEIKDILSKYFSLENNNVDKCVDEIVEIIKSEHIAKEHFREEYVNMIIEQHDKKSVMFCE